MADKYVRKLAAYIGFDIDHAPLAKLDKTLDSVKNNLSTSGIPKFEVGVSSLNRQSVMLGGSLTSVKQGVTNLGAAASASGSKIQTIGNNMRSVSNEIKKTGSIFKDLERGADAALTSIGNKATSLGKIMGGSVLLGGVAATGAATMAVGSSLGKSIDYEAQLSSIQALTGIGNDELAKMDKLALKMGSDTKYSALQAAQGIEELLKAGMTPATVQAGGLEAALNLATAGGLDLTEAAEAMSDALNGFKKDGLNAAQVSNIMAGAANASSTDVHKLKESLSAVGPVADGIGVSFLGVNATLAAFSNNMLKGSDAGTSLKTFLSTVQPQTKEATELFEKYGLTAKNGTNIFFNATGQLKDMSDVAEVLRNKFKDLNDQQRSDVFFKLFGSDSVRAANILYKEGASGIKEMYRQISDVTALEVAKKKMDNAAGSIEQFKGAVETLQIRTLRPFLPGVKRLFDEMGNYIDRKSPEIISATEKMANEAKTYLKENFIDNQEFRNLPTLKQKAEFVLQNFKTGFDAWYEAGGKDQISSATSSLIGYVSNALDGSSEQLKGVGIKLGGSIGEGMLVGLQNFAKTNPLMSAMFTFILTPGPIQIKALAAAGVAAQGYTSQVVGTQVSEEERVTRGISNPFYHEGGINIPGSEKIIQFGSAIRNTINGFLPKVDGSNKDGLSYVPFDGYISELHQGERVLTAEENRDYSLGAPDSYGAGYNDSSMSFSPTIHITIQGNGDKQSAYDGTMEALNAFARSYMRRNPQVVIR